MAAEPARQEQVVVHYFETLAAWSLANAEYRRLRRLVRLNWLGVMLFAIALFVTMPVARLVLQLMAAALYLGPVAYRRLTGETPRYLWHGVVHWSPSPVRSLLRRAPLLAGAKQRQRLYIWWLEFAEELPLIDWDHLIAIWWEVVCEWPLACFSLSGAMLDALPPRELTQRLDYLQTRPEIQ